MIEQILTSVSIFVLNTIESAGYWGIFLLMTLESANIPIPSEIIMPFSGFLVSVGVFRFWPAILVGALGNLTGSAISYYVAIYFEKWTRSWVVKSSYFKKSQNWFNQYGVATVFWSRLLPVVRTFISFPAGLFRVNPKRFLAYTFLGSLIWSAILIYPGIYLGANWSVIEPIFRRFDALVLVVLAIGFIVALRAHGQRMK
jgi:membrane protein DedA with SNARE-associated domain